MIDTRRYQGKRICVAVSGGADSMSLLHFLKATEFSSGFFLSAMTCEHGLRGEESRKDVELVQDYCKKLNVELTVFRADCKKRMQCEKTGLEETARNFRRECYQQIIDQGKADYIATAHHLDDDAETVLFRLCRGTLSGVKGIEEETGYFLRPFLSYTKEEILEYAEKNQVPFRNDKTNFELDATRNKLRLQVLPLLEESVTGAKRNLVRFSSLSAEDDAFLYSLSEKLVVHYDKKYSRDTGVGVLFSKEKPLFSRAVLLCMKELGVEKDYTSEHLQSVYELQNNQTGASVSLKNGLQAVKEYDKIIFCRGEQAEKISVPFCVGELKFGEKTLCVSKEETENCLRADFDKFPENCVVRTPETGDEIVKFGGGTKSLKKYLTDKKIPSGKRNELPVIAKNHTVYAVFGVEISDTVKVTDETKEKIYLYIK